jgi:steroid delta-isomerase-like uncharacterized protein
MTRADFEFFIERHLASLARHDPVALAADHSAEGILESPMFALVQGRTAIAESYRALFKSFPDFIATANVVLVDAPNVAVFSTVNATHMNDFLGLAGTQRRVEFETVLLFTFEEGLIAREKRIYDFTGFLLQLGVLRAKPAKP